MGSEQLSRYCTMENEKNIKKENRPVCQFGPGGDFRTVIPKGADMIEAAAKKELSPKMMAKLAADLGYEVPLVATGPGAIKWQKKPKQLKRAVRSLLEVLHEVRPEVKPDHKLVAEHIRSAEAALEMLQAKPVEMQATAPAAIETPKIVTQASADIEQVAMKSDTPCRVLADRSYTVANKSEQTQTTSWENQNVHSNTQAATDSKVHKRLSPDTRLFPDDAGDWGSPEAYKGYSLRTHRRTGKKRRAVARGKAQGSLFSGC